MVEACKRLIDVSSNLKEDERNLVSVAYKNIVGSRRSAYRILSNIEAKPEATAAHLKMMSEYKEKVRNSIRDLSHLSIQYMMKVLTGYNTGSYIIIVNFIGGFLQWWISRT